MIRESPEANWFVRPESGGQFGPAAGQVFHQWLKEERVAEDSLVWREGWEEWQPAGRVLADFFATFDGKSAALPSSTAELAVAVAEEPLEFTEPGVSGAPVSEALVSGALASKSAVAAVNLTDGSSAAPTLSERNRLSRKRKKRRNYTIMISLLVVVSIVLVCALAYVLFS